MTIQPGQVYRDKSHDLPRCGHRGRRTVEIITQEPDGRWLAKALTTNGGSTTKPRVSRIKPATLATSYELASK